MNNKEINDIHRRYRFRSDPSGRDVGLLVRHIKKTNRLTKNLPQTADNHTIYPNMKLWYDGSDDSFRGPHQCRVLGMEINRPIGNKDMIWVQLSEKTGVDSKDLYRYKKNIKNGTN